MSADQMLTHWEGEPIRVWEILWRLPRLEAYGRISSTNDRIRRLADEGARPFSAVLAEEQSAGRGRSGRIWRATPGSSLLISFLLPLPDESARRVTPLVLGIAVARAIEDVGVGPATIKWPNDVCVDGRKVSGVLCEAGWGGEPAHVVAGIGINVRQKEEDFPAKLKGAATSLELAARGSVSRAELAGRVVARVREVQSPGPRRLEDELAREMERRDALRGRWVRLGNGTRGRALGVSADGTLLVETPEGQSRVTSGSVRVLDASDN